MIQLLGLWHCTKPKEKNERPHTAYILIWGQRGDNKQRQERTKKKVYVLQRRKKRGGGETRAIGGAGGRYSNQWSEKISMIP